MVAIRYAIVDPWRMKFGSGMELKSSTDFLTLLKIVLLTCVERHDVWLNIHVNSRAQHHHQV